MADATIAVEDIRAVVTRVLDAVEAQHGGTLELGEDYYWHLPVRAAFDLSKPQPELTTGQLTDDVDELREALARPETVDLAAWHALGHVIAVLRAVERLALP
jgi:hypothetical protein